MDSGELIGVIYTDFLKAFDTIMHSRLLLVIQYSINAYLERWLAIFVQQEAVFIFLDGEQSSWLDVISGIPQDTY